MAFAPSSTTPASESSPVAWSLSNCPVATHGDDACAERVGGGRTQDGGAGAGVGDRPASAERLLEAVMLI
jgi:hypothetical protein